MNKKIFFGSLLSTTIVATPAIVSSCSLPTGDINKGQQAENLVSESSKNVFLDEWITNTFISLYIQNNYPNIESNIKTTTLASYKYYLDHLSWPIASNQYADITQEKKTEFETLLKNAYKFYISFKSTIKESGEKPPSPSYYFLDKSKKWKGEGLGTINEINDGNGKILTIADFNPTRNYTGLDSTNNIIEKDFKILIQTRGTLVYQNVMKLLLSEMYFLKNNQKLVENGTNFKKMTSKRDTVDFINNMAYVNNNDFSTFMLKKYIVESSPHFTWSYSSDDLKNYNNSSIISTLLEFNNMSITKETTLGNILSPSSTESEANSINKLQAFNKLDLSTTTDSGDLSIALDNIKMYGDSKIGLLDSSKKLLFTFTELNAIKEARKYNSTNNNALMIPSININAASQSKNAYAIEISDLDISWGGVASTSATENSYTYVNGNVTQTLIINSISFLPANGNKKVINVSFTYKFKTDNSANSEYMFNHNFDISNWGSSDSSQSNPFMNAFYFTGKEDTVGINIYNETGDLSGITYYLRPLPLFKKTRNTLIANDRYMEGYWTYENTPWNTIEKQRTLVYFFTLSDENLYRKIQDFYLFNGYDVQGDVSELQSVISSLNLTKKTNEDRRNEGIIW